MYDSLHRAPKNDDYVTIRYKQYRGQKPGEGGISCGYVSEPEHNSYLDRSATLDSRRRTRSKENDFSTATIPRHTDAVKYFPDYRIQPGRIENYEPGRSSIAEKETKEPTPDPTCAKRKWWDEVMDIFDGPFDQSNAYSPKSYMTHALKESGYESDSTLIFRRREDASPLSPLEQRIAYKTVQKGGDVPLHGLRKPAPERPKDDTTIEYFPISPTLTRIRVHKKSSCCSSATASPASSTSSVLLNHYEQAQLTSMASSLQRLTTSPHRNQMHKKPSSNLISPLSQTHNSNKAPSPPKRKSSRNNRTLKLYSQSVKLDECNIQDKIMRECRFRNEETSRIKLLKDNLNLNLERQKTEREKLQKYLRTHSTSPPPLLRKLDPCLNEYMYKGESKYRLRACSSASPVARSPKVSLLSKKITLEKESGSRQNKSAKLKEEKIISSSCRISRPKSASPPHKKEHRLRKFTKSQSEVSVRSGKSSGQLIATAEVTRSLHRQKGVGKDAKRLSVKASSSETLMRTCSSPATSSRSSSITKLNEKSLVASANILNKRQEFSRKGISREKLRASPILKKSNSKLASKSKEKENNLVLADKFDSKIELGIQYRRSTRSEGIPKNHTSLRETHLFTSKKTPAKLNNVKSASNENITTKSIESPSLSADLLKKYKDITKSENFFQHLLLREVEESSSQNSNAGSIVHERMQKFQEIRFGENYRSEPSLKSIGMYLSTKRPVSNSRFRSWDRESASSRGSSPFGLRLSFSNDSTFLNYEEEKNSNSQRSRNLDQCNNYVKERSTSEPPLKVIHHHEENLVSSNSRRSPSSSPVRKIKHRTEDAYKYENEPSFERAHVRSTSEVDYFRVYQEPQEFNLSLSKSTGSLTSFSTDRANYQKYILERLHSRPKSRRYKELFNFYSSIEKMAELEKATSAADLKPKLKNDGIIDYDQWKQVRTKEKAERELKSLHKRVKYSENENDFLFTTRDINRYKWQGDPSLRCKEQSVENIRNHFKKLEKESNQLEATKQRDLDFKKDNYKPLWRGNSVVNVANTMTKRAEEKADFDKSSVRASLQKSLGGSNKFWSSLSLEQVTALKNQLNDIFGSDHIKACKVKPSEPSSESIFEKSSEILEDTSANLNLKSEMTSKYEIVIPKKRDRAGRKGLHVRCHSMTIADRSVAKQEESENMKRSGSISQVSSLERSCSERIRSSLPLSETEKKELSQTLGKEMLNKINKRSAPSTMIKPRETMGAIAAASAKIDVLKTQIPNKLVSNVAMEEKHNFDIVIDETDSRDKECNRRIEKVFTEWSYKPDSADQADTGTDSSDVSIKTVVGNINARSEEVSQKVEFFEKADEISSVPSVQKYHFRLSSSQSFSDLKELFGESKSAKYCPASYCKTNSSSSSLSVLKPERKNAKALAEMNEYHYGSSQVANNIRRTFRSAALGLRDLERPRSASPYRGVTPTTESTSYCSLENLYQRNSSPDPEQHWQNYLKLVKNGTVKRLRAKFESLEELGPEERAAFLHLPKRFQSDPELARNLLNKVFNTSKRFTKSPEFSEVAWIRQRYESSRARRTRDGNSPIPRVPWRVGDLTMPHINRISKTAELKDQSSQAPSSGTHRQEEFKELETRRPVNRIKEMFETGLSSNSRPSILGEMFTSAPNVHELRDIAPYLTGNWVAHMYPSRYDNSRSLSSPPDLSRADSESNLRSCMTPSNRKPKCVPSRSSSASPVQRTPMSILKNQQRQQHFYDRFANQNFDPSKHRPVYRYQPPPPSSSYLGTKTWQSKSTQLYSTRPTVTFEEYAPPPPPKAHHYRDERQESPRRYVEGEVTIHYRSPVRAEAKEPLSEEELARRSAENMRRVYQEERRRKYLQELHDIDSRRHTDNFTPLQKSPIPLNRYDDFMDELSYRSRSQEQTPEPRLVARALYNFLGQSPRELTFRRGDLIFVRRQIDKNWYEGEHNAMIGLFPLNYVEVIPYDEIRASLPKRPHEGQARAKFNFVAQTNLELSLGKGELVYISRRVDENWYEGRVGSRKGIFPVSYVDVLSEPGNRPETPVQGTGKPVASPAAHSLLTNGSASGKLSIGSHHYAPPSPANYNSLPKGSKFSVPPVNEALHVDTHSEPIAYRVLYNYRPQNDDELELREGETVYVMEKCDDGWYVGSSSRTGYFGTFPGNYVERL